MPIVVQIIVIKTPPFECGRLRRAVEEVVGVMRRMTTVVAMVARCRVDSIHVLTKDSAVTGAQLCQYSYCLFGSGNGQRSAIKRLC